MRLRKSAVSFSARLTRISTKFESSRCAISPFTRRDNTYIDDTIQGTTAALKFDGPMFDVFNLGESETIQLEDLIAAIEKALGKKAKINQLPEQPGDMPLTCADISKARKLLGYNPKTKLSDGLPRFIEWFLRSAK